MAFLPERNFLEETLASNYDLSNGATGFTTSDISEFNTLDRDWETSHFIIVFK